jgi:hypothetical protein
MVKRKLWKETGRNKGRSVNEAAWDNRKLKRALIMFAAYPLGVRQGDHVITIVCGNNRKDTPTPSLAHVM